jgi:hypothetical protein
MFHFILVNIDCFFIRVKRMEKLPGAPKPIKNFACGPEKCFKGPSQKNGPGPQTCEPPMVPFIQILRQCKIYSRMQQKPF